MSDKNILVMGLGNLLLSDEGVGIHAIRELQKRSLLSNFKSVTLHHTIKRKNGRYPATYLLFH